MVARRSRSSVVRSSKNGTLLSASTSGAASSLTNRLPSCGRAASGLDLLGRQRIRGRAPDDLARRIVAGPVARAVPRAIAVVPVDDAPHVRAASDHRDDGAILVAEHPELAAVHVDHGAVPRSALPE